jgi:hypothetical protein
LVDLGFPRLTFNNQGEILTPEQKEKLKAKAAIASELTAIIIANPELLEDHKPDPTEVLVALRITALIYAQVCCFISSQRRTEREERWQTTKACC